jgi:hypothetical protein
MVAHIRLHPPDTVEERASRGTLSPVSPVTKRTPANKRNPLRALFEALDADFDRWEEHYLSLGDTEARAVLRATASTRRYSNRMARHFGLDVSYLWHAYLAWQEHWIAFTKGTTDVAPNRRRRSV